MPLQGLRLGVRRSRRLFNPIDLGGLAQWLHADRGITQVSGAVSRWADQSGAGNDATQSSGPAKPSLVAGAMNSKSVVRFDGVAQFLSLPNISLPTFSLVMVYKASSKAAFAGPIALSGGAVPGLQLVSDSSTATYRERLLVWSGSAETSAVQDATGVAMPEAAAVHAWTSSPVFRRNNAVITLSAGGTGFTHGSTLGKSQDFFGMDLRQLLLFSRVLSSSELTTVARWAANDAGIAVS